MMIIELEGGGVIEIEFCSECAPNTVRNFRALVDKGFYNGQTVYRTVKDRLIQIGCPLGKGIAGAGYTIFGEFTQNGWENPMSGKRGEVFAGRYSDAFNSGNSQFFICQKDLPEVEGLYAGFGRVVKGMEEVDRLSTMETFNGEHPLHPEKIVRVYLRDDEAPIVEPDKMPAEFSKRLKYPISE